MKSNRLRKVKDSITKLIDLPKKNKITSLDSIDLSYELRNNIILNLIECHFMVNHFETSSKELKDNLIKKIDNQISFLKAFKGLSQSKDDLKIATKEQVIPIHHEGPKKLDEKKSPTGR